MNIVLATLIESAPEEIPAWFVPNCRPAPDKPDFEPDTGNSQLDSFIRNWQRDPCWDIDPWNEEQFSFPVTYEQKLNLIKYVDDWKTYWQRRRKYYIQRERERYLQWRIFFAENMLNRIKGMNHANVA